MDTDGSGSDEATERRRESRMISNAVLSRIDVPGTPTPQGAIAYTTGTTIAVRVAFDEVTRSQSWSLSSLIKDAQAVAYVLESAGVTIDRGYRLVIALDGRAASTWEVTYVRDRVKGGGLGHRECFVKAV